MEKGLFEAAVEGDVNSLRQLLRQDGLLLDKQRLNCGGNTPLHIAALLGHVEFVRAIVDVNSDMCLALDRDGRNPLHIAAMKGRLDILRLLIDARPLAARERSNADGRGTVLHLCVEYNQLKALKMLVETVQDEELLNAKNDEGMTVLHLAVWDEQIETIKYLLEKNIDANAKNANGYTALDYLRGEKHLEVESSLRKAAALQVETVKSKKDSHESGAEWLRKKRKTIMVVASLIATMAFQAAVSPPGGVWQDDKTDGSKGKSHAAGEAVMAHKHPKSYRYYLRANTVAFVSSLSIILLLISGLPFRKRLFMWALMIVMWLTITSIALTYGISIVIVTPKENKDPLSHVIDVAVIVWCGVMALLLLGNTIRLIKRWLRKEGISGFGLRKYWNSAVVGPSKNKKEASQNCGCGWYC